MNTRSPASDAWQTFRSVYWTLAAAMAIVLVLLAVLGFGPGGRNCKPVTSAATSAAAEGAGMATATQPSPQAACWKA
jgi:Na+/H+ antiporter NhaC